MEEGPVVVVPYLLVTTLLAQRAHVEGIAELFKHEAQHAVDLGVRGKTDNHSAEHEREVESIIEKLRPNVTSNQRGIIVTVVGGAGTGKSTVARVIAKKMDAFNIGAGLVYRALAWIAFSKGTTPVDKEFKQGISELLKDVELSIQPDTYETRVIYLGTDITEDIELKRVQIESVLDAKELGKEVHDQVVKYLLEIISEIIESGRDVVVEMRPKLAKNRIPNNKVEVLLGAPSRIRAERRTGDLIQNLGLERAYLETTANDKKSYSVLLGSGEEAVREKIIDAVEGTIIQRDKDDGVTKAVSSVDADPSKLVFDTTKNKPSEISEIVSKASTENKAIYSRNTAEIDNLVVTLRDMRLQPALNPETRSRILEVFPALCSNLP